MNSFVAIPTWNREYPLKQKDWTRIKGDKCSVFQLAAGQRHRILLDIFVSIQMHFFSIGTTDFAVSFRLRSCSVLHWDYRSWVVGTTRLIYSSKVKRTLSDCSQKDTEVIPQSSPSAWHWQTGEVCFFMCDVGMWEAYLLINPPISGETIIIVESTSSNLWHKIRGGKFFKTESSGEHMRL